MSTIPDTDIDMKVGTAIKALWKDPGQYSVISRLPRAWLNPIYFHTYTAIQKTWARRSEFQIVESMKYYFNKIDEIMQPNYLASDDDILYARVRTSGIVTER